MQRLLNFSTHPGEPEIFDLVQDRGGGILKYSEDLNFASKKDIGPEDFFQMTCNQVYQYSADRPKSA